MTIRVVIVDDEPLARRGIAQLLARHPDVTVIGEAGDGAEAVTQIQSLGPDVVFLDVQMPEIDGFGVLRALDSAARPYVVFVTAYDHFAVSAFEAEALDYLVKPVHEDRFETALSRLRSRLRTEEAAAAAVRLARLVELRTGGATRPTSEGPRRLVVSAPGADLVLDVADVTWIEADDYYAAVHAGGRRHLVRESLASLEQRLDTRQFIRVHRSAIVNLSHVGAVRSTASGEPAVVLRDGTTVPVSRRRRELVDEAVRRFAG
jgi:two-component system LytT family response regulator